ncbi:hypothetical protein V500_11235 [Pseudogymnoascus sp. VKM F-4518 (FW-2643)]|nr:hypothetical protein V500_11235 [Pseudogymnoascus sp. VKM F-4518 (FW-2643)]
MSRIPSTQNAHSQAPVEALVPFGSTVPPPKRFLKRYRTEIAASSSSVMSTILSFPLDSVKTRMQTYRYNSFIDCVHKTYQTEKIRGFFRGVTAPVASITFVRTVSMSVYQRSKYTYSGWMKRNFGVDPMSRINTPGNYPSFSTLACVGAAGATAGSFITIVACPFELTKLSAQVSVLMAGKNITSSLTDPTGTSNTASSNTIAASYQNKGTWSTAQHIVKTRGIGGLYSGFSLHLLRDTLGTAIYFMTYESVKQVLLTYRGDNTTTSPVAVAGAGGLCGVVSWALIYPIDSAKSIFQRNCLMHQKGDLMKKPKIQFSNKRINHVSPAPPGTKVSHRPPPAMPREKARGAAHADAAARRPAAVQKHRKGKKGRDAARVAKVPKLRAPQLPRPDLVAAPVHAKLKYANSYWEFTENKERKKKLEFCITNEKTPPAGFTFVPVGNPELSKACKEVSREEGAMIFIVSNTKEQNHNLFDHIHRIGFHFRSYIVDQAASTLGGLQAVTGDGKPIVANSGDEIPETQEEINKQADAALRDLFPRIPNTDREMIIQHAFQKGAIFQGKPVVGLQPELTLSRRVQLAANAHIRHNHTRYDQLLHETDYLNARRVVEPLCLDFIMKWRGDEETGRDQLDELLREVVVIPDSDEESEEVEESASDDDEVQFLREVVHAAPRRQGTNPPRQGNRFHVDDPRRNMEQPSQGDEGNAYSEIATRTRSKKARGWKDKQARRGFKRYQAWEDAQKRQQATHSEPSGQPLFDDRRNNESRQAHRPANNVSGFYGGDERLPAEEPQRLQINVVENQPRYRELPVSRPLESVQYQQLPVSRAPESGHYVQREVMLRSNILDQYKNPPPRSTYEYVNRPLVAEAGEPRRSDAPRAREPRQLAGTTRPFSPHDVLPSIERGDLPSDHPDRRDSPVMMSARQVRNAPPRAHEEQVLYTRGEPEPKRFRPLPVHSNVIYVDEPEVVPKRRRVAADPGVFQPANPGIEYVRLRPVPRADDRFFPSSSSAASSQGIEARRYDNAFPQNAVVDSQPPLMSQQPLAPRELRPVRHVPDHDAAFGKLSLDDRAQRGESQAPMRQRVEPGPSQLRVVEQQQQPSAYVSENRRPGEYERRYTAQEPQYYQRPVAVAREQAEYQSRAPAPVYAALPGRPPAAERPRSELPPRPPPAERPRSEFPPRPLAAERPRSALPARLLPAERAYSDFESQPVEYRRVPSRDQQFREVRTRPQEDIGAPRYVTRQVRPRGEEVRYEVAPGAAPNGPKMYSRSTPRPGEVIVLD